MKISPAARIALTACLLCSALALLPARVHAALGDTTWVHTYVDDFYNWADHHQRIFTFPDSSLHTSKILLVYRLGCPGAPGDCDPWDRLGYLQVRQAIPGADSVWTEIARVVTPYDITGSGYPGSCSWQLDVSDYEPLLHGQVRLDNYIESWIGGNKGWLVTIDFAFIEGEPDLKPYRIQNLWENYYAVYGNPNNPISNTLYPKAVTIDSLAAAVKVRVITTGHGQGNTGNCAEFCEKEHTIIANGQSTSHFLWRSDCNSNPCSPQGGTWRYNRAGWCPGSAVYPWDVDVTGFVTPGSQADLNYTVQAYENFCRPDNPSCISGQTCADCNYNYNGHTEPIYAIRSQLISYRINPIVGVGPTVNAGPGTGLPSQVRPNPGRPPVSIEYAVRDAGPVRIAIYDASGRLVNIWDRTHERGGSYLLRWDGRDASGNRVPAGVYLYQIRAGSLSGSKKILVLE